MLLVMACETNLRGQFIARELAADRSLDSLYAFGARLHDVYVRHIVPMNLKDK